MAKSMRALFASLAGCESGSAFTLTALAMPVLIGGAGIAVDVSQWYLWKNELQFAVDQAAVAGAWARTDSATENTYVTRATQEFETNLSVVEGHATPTVALADYDGGSQNAIEVSASMTRALPFTSMFLSGGTEISAMAWAVWEGADSQAPYVACMIALSETESAAVLFNGNPTVDAGCGLMSLSNAADSIRISGSPGEYNMGSVVAAGGIYDQHGGFDEANVQQNVGGLSNPFEGLTPPDNPTPRELSCGSSSTTYTADATTTVTVSYSYFKGSNQNNAQPHNYGSPKQGSTATSSVYGQSLSSPPENGTETGQQWTQISGNGQNKIFEVKTTTTSVNYANIQEQVSGGGTMQPGTYSDFTVGCDTVLAPGVYVIDGGQFSVTGGNELTGSGVMFVLKNGASIQVAGNSTIDLTGMSESQLIAAGVSAEDAAKMVGMLIFEDPDGPGASEHKFRGTADISLGGIIYTPNTPFSMLGTPQGNSRCLSIAAMTVQIGGTADLTNLCPSGVEPDIKVPQGNGVAVRLVR